MDWGKFSSAKLQDTMNAKYRIGVSIDIAYQADVDVASQLHALLGPLVHPSQQHEQDAALDVQMPEDRRADAARRRR